MSSSLAIQSSPLIFNQSTQSLPQSSTLTLKIKNIVSKYLLEPAETFWIGLTTNIRIIIWLLQKPSSSSFRFINLWATILKPNLDKEFQKTGLFQNLKAIDPLFLNNPKNLQKFESFLRGGTCFGQGVTLLKYADSLDKTGYSEFIKQYTVLGAHRDETIFFQAAHVLKVKFSLLLELNKFSKNKNDFITPQGEVDRARLFDTLLQMNPGILRSLARAGAELLIIAEDFKYSKAELQEKIKELDNLFNNQLSSSSKPSSTLSCSMKGSAAKVSSFFKDKVGSFMLTGAATDKKSGHAVFIKIKQDTCMVYDPALSLWTTYDDVKTGIARVIDCMLKTIPSTKSAAFTLHQVK